jgi:hypothetical protein
MKIAIPHSLTKNWSIDKKNILESKNKHSGERIFKFSYYPEAGELLFAAEPESHMEMIDNLGAHRFGMYVRGIYFREKKTVYFRGHEDEKALEETKQMLRENGVPESVRIIWGEKAAKELAEELRGL